MKKEQAKGLYPPARREEKEKEGMNTVKVTVKRRGRRRF